MLVKHIKGATRVVGKSQGYVGLPIKDGTVECTVNGPGTPQMSSSWELTPAELKLVNSGAPIILSVVGVNHPPVILKVRDTPNG